MDMPREKGKYTYTILIPIIWKIWKGVDADHCGGDNGCVRRSAFTIMLVCMLDDVDLAWKGL